MRTPKPWALPTQPVTRALLSSSGVSDEMIRTQLRAGRLIRLRQGVYLARDAWPESDAALHVMLARAEQVVNPTAVISHESAAVVWGLPTPGFTPWHVSKPSVTLPDKGLHGWSGTATRHEARLPTSDLTRDSDGYIVTTVARTAIDLARPPPVPPPAGGRARRPRTGVSRRVPDRWASSPLRTAPAPFPGADRHPARHRLPGLSVARSHADRRVRRCRQVHRPAVDRRREEREQLLRDLGYRIVRWLAKEIMTRPDLVLARIERALLS